VTKAYDAALDLVQLQPQVAWGQALMFGVGLAALVSIQPVLCWSIYSRDIHVLFWLGQAPTYGLLLVPIVCFGIVFLAPSVKLFKLKFRGTRIFCVALWTISGLILLGAGLYVTMEVMTVGTRLLHKCGNDPLSKELEDQWQQLDTFYKECDPRRVKPITGCKGFGAKFREGEFVNYIDEVELQFGSTGFCEFSAKPVFDKHSDPSLRCATALGTYLESLALTVGVYVAGVGGAILAVGVCMAGYDHL
jgi:hypothetical protein